MTEGEFESLIVIPHESWSEILLIKIYKGNLLAYILHIFYNISGRQ